jgi:hypothetical protein
MKLWAQLYLLTWLMFFEIWLALTPIVPPVPEYLHAILGLAIIVLAGSNAHLLRRTAAPGRIKRTARVTFEFSVATAFLGVPMFFHVGGGSTILLGITVLGFLTFLHFVLAMAMITQAAAVGIAYDMWEEKEFEKDTLPGEVPPQIAPGG